MNKKWILPVIIGIFLGLCGCGHEEAVNETVSQETMTQESDTSASEGIPDTSEPVLEARNQWQDNSLDLYTGQINHPLRPEQPQGARDGGGIRYLLGASQAAVFKKHLFADYTECWDGLVVVTDRGEEQSERIQLADEGINQVWNMGEIYGSDNYLIYYRDMGENEEVMHVFFIVDPEFHIISRIEAKDLPGEVFPDNFIMDISGNIHILVKTTDSVTYYVLDPQGKLLAEYTNDSYWGLKFIPLYDGRVALYSCVFVEEGEEPEPSMLWTLDWLEGREQLLATMPQDRRCYYYTLWDDSTLVYTTQEGLYRSDLSGDNQELLYEWSKHGIQMKLDGVIAMRCTQNREISLLYADLSGINYLCLKPTEENIDIQEITLAVSASSKSAYQVYAAEFNRKYPTYVIRLVEDYDSTKLLTELTAGDGPVLIDTGLTGFYQHPDLWEPLDDMIAQAQLENQLLPQAMGLGKINDTLYGLVGGWTIKTVAAASVDLDGWNYASFMQYIEGHPELTSIYNNQSSWAFIRTFFIHSLEDNCLIDTKDGSLGFDSENFRQILLYAEELADEKKAVNSQSDMISALREGSMLCYELTLYKPEELSLWRAQLGDSMKYMGYPGQNGSQHYIYSSMQPIVIRNTASEQEKEIARLFLQNMLSYESQIAVAQFHNLFNGMSVRRDVFEEQLADMPEVTYFADSSAVNEPMEIVVDKERDSKEFNALLEQAVPYPYFPVELNTIMLDELSDYFSGVQTEDQMINHMENRMRLYMAEQN